MEDSRNQGLSSEQARENFEKYGPNELSFSKKKNLFRQIFGILCEPMFLLLIAAAVIYFILGEARDGAVMLVFVLGVISIDVFQEIKTDKTLEALKELSAPQTEVCRNGVRMMIPSREIVPEDIIYVCEGVKIPADGVILSMSDLCTDESMLTGEAEGAWKVRFGEKLPQTQDKSYFRADMCYAGTLVTRGSAEILVKATGANTEYGKIGKSIAEAENKQTPLEKQTSSLVKTCSMIAAALFVLVMLITFFSSSEPILKQKITSAVLAGITLAMAMIPEEFPVILTVFLSLGASRLAKKNSLVKKLPCVETLGAVSVLCVDKTGTVTENKMRVDSVYAPFCAKEELIETMGLACESETYDPMEKAMLSYCESEGVDISHIFSGEMLTEYPFTNETKMMGHVWEHEAELVIAAKGSPEGVLKLCELNERELSEINERISLMAKEGLRVIAVAKQDIGAKADIPSDISLCKLTFTGLVGLSDPPVKNMAQNIMRCKNAGIRVVMITGDSGETALSIADKVGIDTSGGVITGEILDSLSDEELAEAINKANIFSRVIPEHKLRIVNAFKAKGHIVAMTGDGVNDAPALKHADIGIAMGKRGSEVCREAADLILLDDNFSTIVDTIADARRIYDNIRKAVGYVFTIHIPIALSCLIAPMLGLNQAELFLLPLHVVLLELVLDPTCSVVLERQPAEENLMNRPPRESNENVLTRRVLLKSLFQGLGIFTASFGLYYFMLANGSDVLTARSMGLCVIMLSNMLLVQVNSSNTRFMYQSIGLLKNDKLMWCANIATIAGLALILYTPLSNYLKLAPLSAIQAATACAAACAGVLWYEIVKAVKKSK